VCHQLLHCVVYLAQRTWSTNLSDLETVAVSGSSLGKRTCHILFIHFSVSLLFLTKAFSDYSAIPNLAASVTCFLTGIHVGQNVCFYYNRECFPLLWFTHCDGRQITTRMEIKLFASLIRSRLSDLLRVQHLLLLITRFNQKIIKYCQFTSQQIDKAKLTQK
jgi:hypothetical protein